MHRSWQGFCGAFLLLGTPANASVPVALPLLENVITANIPIDPRAAPDAMMLTRTMAGEISDAVAATIARKREFALCFAAANMSLIITKTIEGGATSVDDCPALSLVALHTHPSDSPAIFSDNDLRANYSLATRRFTMASAVAATDGSLLVAIETRASLAKRAAWIARAGPRREEAAIATAISSAARAEALARLAYVQPGPRAQAAVIGTPTRWTGAWLAAATPLLELGVADYCERLALACYIRHSAQEPLRKLSFDAIAQAVQKRPDLRIDRAIAGTAMLIQGPPRPGARRRPVRTLRALFALDYRPLESLTKPEGIVPSFRYQEGGRYSLQKFRGRIGIQGTDRQSAETALGAFAADPACIRFGRQLRMQPAGKEGEADVYEIVGGSFDLICVRNGTDPPLWLRQHAESGAWATDAVTPVRGLPAQGLLFNSAGLCEPGQPADQCQARIFMKLPDLPRWDGSGWVLTQSGRSP